jgi:dynein heavy chain, axonemal
LNQVWALIQGLAGERARWTEDAANFIDQKMKLVGDCALGCAFVSYGGPFNQQFGQYLVQDKFTGDLERRGVPVSTKLDIVSFLVDIGTVGDWNIQGLPTDPLSTQNGILVTESTRFPLLVDPQGQALNWIKSKEAKNLPSWAGQTLINISDPKLKGKLKFCMGNGRTLVIIGVENDIDPMLDPELEKQFIVKDARNLSQSATKSWIMNHLLKCISLLGYRIQVSARRYKPRLLCLVCQRTVLLLMIQGVC